MQITSNQATIMEDKATLTSISTK